MPKLTANLHTCPSIGRNKKPTQNWYKHSPGLKQTCFNFSQKWKNQD